MDSCVLGPVSLGVTEVCQVLGVNSEMAAGSRRRRQDLVEEGERPGWLESERGARHQGQEARARGGRGRTGVGASPGLPRSSLERQFDLFTR